MVNPLALERMRESRVMGSQDKEVPRNFGAPRVLSHHMRPFHALTAVLATLAVLTGCTSSPPEDTEPDAGTGDGGSTPVADATWYRDVLPIVQARCQQCHTTGGIAPFPLDTYADALKMHPSMAGAASSRRMPPWMPDESCVSYMDSRRLPQAEIDTLVAWSDAGAPEGDPADAPPPPSGALGLPQVDVTLDAGEDYTPKSFVPDDYRCFILDPKLSQNRDVIGYDILPTVRAEVHHVLLYVTTLAQAQAKDGAEAGPGWTCYGGPGVSSSRVLGGWVPGSSATRFPVDTGIRLQAGEVVVMQIHYNTSQRLPLPDRTVTQLQYSPQPVKRLATLAPLAQSQFSIPPHGTDYSASATLNTPASGRKLYGVLPHMHTLGKRIRVENTNTGQCFLNIPQWDFHWQQLYFFEQAVSISSQNTLKLTCTWDNFTDRTVTWGEGTEDEMCINYFYSTEL
jgi:hypothetical protein